MWKISQTSSLVRASWSLLEPELSPSSIIELANNLIKESGGSGDFWDSAIGTDNGGNIDEDPLVGVSLVEVEEVVARELENMERHMTNTMYVLSSIKRNN